MGVTEPEVLLTADPALIRRRPRTTRPTACALRAGIPPHGNYLCFAPAAVKGLKRRPPLFGAAAEYAYRTYGLTPVFVAVEKHLDPGAGQPRPRADDPPLFPGRCRRRRDHHRRPQPDAGSGVHAAPRADLRRRAGDPLAGVVYDPKVSAFLRYIGQEQFVDLAELTGQNLCAMMDQCVAQAAHPEAQAAAVRKPCRPWSRRMWRWPRLLKG